MAASDQLKLAFYGDDITGSTDALEALELAGVPTALFLEPPTPVQIRERFPHIQAIGLAGMSRTMTPEEMGENLPEVFAALKALGAKLTHYKVCSTFDSSPAIGSIGRALDIGMEIFQPSFVPVVVGAPKLKRYVLFGNLFATVNDETYRIDRHPVMSKHPITPMDEGDLRLHLGRQTDKKIGLLDIRHLAQTEAEIDQSLQRMITAGIEVIVMDTLDREHLLRVGQLLNALGQKEQSFIVGSSGVEFALSAHWQTAGEIQPPQQFKSPGPVEQVVAISGSASPWTAAQIRWAFENGFQGIPLDSARLVDPETQETERQVLIDRALRSFADGQSVMLYSALGPEDPQIARTRERAKALGLSSKVTGEILGSQQGLILKKILQKTGLRRAAVAGGDTCGHALKPLSVYGLEFIIPLGLAAPLCLASAYDPTFDGMEIALKGGQLGDRDFFGSLKRGGSGSF